MDRDKFTELVYETFADEPDNVLANGIIEAADAYVEHEKAQLSKEGTTKGTTYDTISRQAAIGVIEDYPHGNVWNVESMEEMVDKIKTLPTAQPEPQEGHWIPHESPDGGEQYECPRCGVLWEFNDGTPEDNEAYFCPKCGADLRGKQNEL